MNKYVVPKKEDVVWFAGFFDGEGCVTLHRKLRRNGKPCYELLIQVAGTHFLTLDTLSKIWGFGTVRLPKFANIRWKPCWHWLVYGSKALFLLENILPYLVTKKGDAILGITFQKWKTSEAIIYGKNYRPSESYDNESKFKDWLSISHKSGVTVDILREAENILKSKINGVK